MTARTEHAALVLLLRSGRRPLAQYADVVEDAGSALVVLDEELGLFAREQLEAAEQQLVHWEAHGFRLHSVLDADYPDNLRAVHDRPPLLFVAGHLELADA